MSEIGGQPGPAALPPELDPRGRRGRRPTGTVGTSSRRRRLLTGLAALTSLAVLGVSTAGYAVVHYYDGNIERLPSVFGSLPGHAQPPPAPQDAENYLIVGSDSRGNLGAGEGVQGEGAAFVTGQRSDTVILAHLYGGGADKAQLISFPRDTLVVIPEHPDSDTGKPVSARTGKLNSAIEYGGPQLLIATIENLTRIRIDHYLQIDFEGFQGMVDGLGGVEVCLSAPAKDRVSGVDLPAGRQVINGTDALAFVRQRNGLKNGDLGRIQRQQQVLGSMIREAMSAGTLANPVKLNRFLTVATASLQVDEDLAFGDLRDLGLRMRGFDAGGVIFTTVPITGVETRKRVGSVVVLDEVKSRQLFEDLRRDRPPAVPAPAPSVAPPVPLIVAPSAIRVRLYNGAGVDGLGRRAATDLEAVGFRVVGTPTDRDVTTPQTVVLHGASRADSARTVAAAIPGARTELDPALGSTLEVVLGASYTGAKQVTVGARRAPTRSPSAAPQVRTAAEDPCSA